MVCEARQHTIDSGSHQCLFSLQRPLSKQRDVISASTSASSPCNHNLSRSTHADPGSGPSAGAAPTGLSALEDGLRCKAQKREAADQSADQVADTGVQQSGDRTAFEEAQYQGRHDDLDAMYKLRNGRGQVLQTPKRSSVARAKALLTTPQTSPCPFSITGSNWPVANLVRVLSAKSPVCLAASGVVLAAGTQLLFVNTYYR